MLELVDCECKLLDIGIAYTAITVLIVSSFLKNIIIETIQDSQ